MENVGLISVCKTYIETERERKRGRTIVEKSRHEKCCEKELNQVIDSNLLVQTVRATYIDPNTIECIIEPLLFGVFKSIC